MGKNSLENFFSRTSDKRRKKKKRNRKSKSKSKSPQCLLEDEELVTTTKENHPNLTTASEDSSVTIHNLKEDDKKDDEAARLIFQLKSKRCTTAKNVFAQGLLLSLFLRDFFGAWKSLQKVLFYNIASEASYFYFQIQLFVYIYLSNVSCLFT